MVAIRIVATELESTFVGVHLIITIDTFVIQQLCYDTFRIPSWYKSFR